MQSLVRSPRPNPVHSKHIHDNPFYIPTPLHPCVQHFHASSNPSRIPSTTALSSHPAELLLLRLIFKPLSTSSNLVCAHVRKLAFRLTSSQLSSSVNVVFISWLMASRCSSSSAAMAEDASEGEREWAEAGVSAAGEEDVDDETERRRRRDSCSELRTRYF